jgi:hypothetical protein
MHPQSPEWLWPKLLSIKAKISSRVGGQRVTVDAALFQPPLPKPRVNLSISRGFPVTLCQRELTVSISLRAERITRVLSTDETWSPASLRPVRDFLTRPGGT